MKIPREALALWGVGIRQKREGVSLPGLWRQAPNAIKDVLISMAPKSVTILVGLISSILIARGLGPDGLGKYALIVSISSLVSSLADLGVGQTAIRYASRAVAEGKAGLHIAVLNWAFRLRLILVSLVVSFVFVISPFVAERLWHDQGLAEYVRYSLLVGIFASLSAIPTIYYQSLKRFGINALISSVQALVLLGGIIFIALTGKWSLGWIIASSIVAVGVGAAISTTLVPKRIILGPSRESGWHRKGHLYKQAVKENGMNRFASLMTLSTVLVLMITKADVWIMGALLDKDQLGLYDVATRWTIPLVVLLEAINIALWPRASTLHGSAEVTVKLKKTLKLCALAATGGIGYSLAAPALTPYIFGEEFSGAANIALLLCLRYCLAILASPLAVMGYSLGFVNIYWKMNLLQLIFIVSVLFYLLPRIGPIGGAVALIVNELIGIVVIGTLVWLKLRSNGVDNVPA